MHLRNSARRSTRQLVCQSIDLSVTQPWISIWTSQSQIRSRIIRCNHVSIQSLCHHEDASLALWALFVSVFIYFCLSVFICLLLCNCLYFYIFVVCLILYCITLFVCLTLYCFVCFPSSYFFCLLSRKYNSMKRRCCFVSFAAEVVVVGGFSPSIFYRHHIWEKLTVWQQQPLQQKQKQQLQQQQQQQQPREWEWEWELDNWVHVSSTRISSPNDQ